QFWIDLFDIDGEFMRTAGWPQLPGIKTASERVIADTFFGVCSDAVLSAIGENPESPYFGFELLGGVESVSEQHVHTKLVGSTELVHWFYPFLCGDSQWLRGCIMKVDEFYRSMGFEVSVHQSTDECLEIIEYLWNSIKNSKFDSKRDSF